ncbi:MAG: DUF3990 domain-containing protein [Clostridia bacterium]|nr:DUF3990 domain-containing protein [Clostridia bacterium]
MLLHLNFSDISNLECNFDNKYDLVIGPVADDDIIVLFRTFVRGLIDIDTLIKELTYKDIYIMSLQRIYMKY